MSNRWQNPNQRRTKWNLEGTFFETCSCEYLCPCIFTNLEAVPTDGHCDFAFCFMVDKGEKDGVNLDGVKAILLMTAPGIMLEGGFTGGLIVDETASEAQAEAIVEILTGAAGGPMEGLAPLVAEVKGVERRPIKFERDGMHIKLTAGEMVDHELDGVPSPAAEGEPIFIRNTLHPANDELALAKARKNMFNGFGINWMDSSGTRNAHFAPFNWSSA